MLSPIPILRLRPCASANPGDDTSTASMAPITIRRIYIVMLPTTVSCVRPRSLGHALDLRRHLLGCLLYCMVFERLDAGSGLQRSSLLYPVLVTEADGRRYTILNDTHCPGATT